MAHFDWSVLSTEMPKILLVKTTSLGDLIHTMPAVTDLQRALPNAELHWLVEEPFAAIPGWHPFVQKAHTCAIRRWRKSFLSATTHREISALKQALLAENYDLVIDAQGLVKSALMVRWLKAEKHGYDKFSIREKLASLAYRHKHSISREQDAISRVRQLLAESCGYQLDTLERDFGLKVQKPADFGLPVISPYVVFLHGTNWVSKIWPVSYWKKLAAELMAQGIQVYIPWGNAEEKERAETIAEGTEACVLPKLSLSSLAYLLQQANAVVGSDTGLAHLAAALDTPTLGIYGSTSVELTGLQGRHVLNLQSNKACSPCMKRQCPLVAEGEIIPCYESVGPDLVRSNVLENIVSSDQ